MHEDPYLLDSTTIFNANPFKDYEQLKIEFKVIKDAVSIHSYKIKVLPTHVSTMHHGSFKIIQSYLLMIKDKINMNLHVMMTG